jgi:hypothetical protein
MCLHESWEKSSVGCSYIYSYIIYDMIRLSSFSEYTVPVPRQATTIISMDLATDSSVLWISSHYHENTRFCFSQLQIDICTSSREISYRCPTLLALSPALQMCLQGQIKSYSNLLLFVWSGRNLKIFDLWEVRTSRGIVWRRVASRKKHTYLVDSAVVSYEYFVGWMVSLISSTLKFLYKDMWCCNLLYHNQGLPPY